MALRYFSTGVLLSTILIIPILVSAQTTDGGLNISGPSKVSYNELRQLAQSPQISPALSKKVQKLLHTPFIYRNPQANGATLVTHPDIGPSLRVAAWNMERGFHAEEIADKLLIQETPTEDLINAPDESLPNEDEKNESLKDEGLIKGEDLKDESLQVDDEAVTAPEEIPAFTPEDKPKDKTPKPSLAQTKQEEWEWLAKSQVLLLTEIDNGMGRTQYHDITARLAKRLHMNAAYGVEFLELAPLSKRMQDYAKAHGNKIQVAGEDFNVDPKQYKGMHGSAILSRYPILGVQMIRLPDCYDWLKGEQNKLTELEKVRRTVSDKIFQEVMLTEVRKGGRMAMAVDLSIPELPEKKATFVVAHLENRCKSDCRQKQVAFLLNALKNRHNPVVIGGDFNTSGADASPTSVKKEIRDRVQDPAFWTRQAISLLVPFGYIANAGATVSKYTKNFHNPATPDIPLVLPNPEYQFFKTLKTFQFTDGHVFDLRGEDASAYNNRGGFMASSNQRALKGFVPTFEFERPLLKGFLGTYKLDWFFVKDYMTGEASKEKNTSPLFAPHYARTLRAINKTGKPARKDEGKTTYPRLSDHDPITIDLPLTQKNEQ